MLFLLRKIRKALVTRNKFTTYLLYAIGEIFLVVVGILIALGINNWNQHQKNLAQEQITILNLKKEFQENLAALVNKDMKRLKKVIDACSYLYDHTSPNYVNSTINVDSVLTVSFTYPTWTPSDFVLKDIKNSGLLKSMSDDSLKNLLLDWDRFYFNLNDWHHFYEMRSNRYFDYFMQNGNHKKAMVYNNLGFNKISEFTRSNEDLMRSMDFENSLADKLVSSQLVYNKYVLAIPLLNSIIAACEKHQPD